MARLSPALKQGTPVQVARGEGVHVFDLDGRRYLDFTAGIGVTSTGHCHPRVVAAAQEQVATLIHGQYTTVMHQPLLRLAERLGDVLPQADRDGELSPRQGRLARSDLHALDELALRFKREVARAKARMGR